MKINMNISSKPSFGIKLTKAAEDRFNDMTNNHEILDLDAYWKKEENRQGGFDDKLAEDIMSHERNIKEYKVGAPDEPSLDYPAYREVDDPEYNPEENWVLSCKNPKTRQKECKEIVFEIPTRQIIETYHKQMLKNS